MKKKIVNLLLIVWVMLVMGTYWVIVLGPVYDNIASHYPIAIQIKKNLMSFFYRDYRWN